MSGAPVTCEVRYRIDPDRLADFKLYAETWVRLIERHGGTHHGYYLPREAPRGAGMSFEGLGREGDGDIAIALFSFPDDQTYLGYRDAVAKDPDAMAANARYGENPPFRSYERVFLQRLGEDR
ncbi:NIPSNAP family protein [Neorhizobium sp. NCHU2750]|uniref:NIPSNAP family protein n=1 Tax=Neorhizobium sp. NCHU2750 TaxID=1825976 RepID=UPI000E746EBA|nr:hypothetical protein NCHU2750_30770 [Neorhizobium sp. NCHU2750]